MSAVLPSIWQRVHLDDIAHEPWRNGGGTTRQLLAWPDPSDWRIRLSVADIAQDGPFSTFVGARRWFAVLDGAGVRLRIGERMHRLTPGSEPVDFSGDATVSCALIDGPTQDFNLMARAGNSVLKCVADQWSGTVDAMTFIAAYAHSERATALFDDECIELPKRTLAWRWAQAAGPVHLAGGDALWMAFVP